MKHTKGLIVAAPASGSGKTTVALALMAAFTRRGLITAQFKVGPDFIDPGYHARITGGVSRNLDGWMLQEICNREIFARGANGADVCVVEGVMGLYDGYDGASEAGSTAQMAKWLGLPVLLVVDARSMARSFAALVKGFMEFDPGCTFCGVVANNIGSHRHLDYLQQAVRDLPGCRLLGGIPRNAGVQIPSRHLGLYTAEDHVLTREMISDLGDLAEKHLDLDSLLHELPAVHPGPVRERGQPDTRVRIGVARDRAFCFYYQDNLDLLIQNGLEPVFFSPLKDESLPRDIHGLYLGGGYPELHAAELSRNAFLLESIQRAGSLGMPIYAECGGFMYLCRSLVDIEDNLHGMAGIFPFTSIMQARRAGLGYREIRLLSDTPLGCRGSVLRGHEFHYSRIDEQNQTVSVKQVYGATDQSGEQRSCPGWLKNNTLGSYVHLHFLSRPDVGRALARACLSFRDSGLHLKL
ncbi:cobyrinate a,c-diamide synthase [Desulfonatronospira sp.]|uniref:cobyrinate a,c-diamide synthase n=1 Tax=Desulfonatronospira sp. TaxID=1962951 RepID=UPI0025C65555|nr:cobyrinate a,c-diamide synthase [Desulfonatronospira sp.]